MVRRASMCRRDIKPWRRCVYDDFFVTNEGRNQAIQAAEGSSIACVLVDNTNDRISFREPRTPLNDAAFQAFADVARPRPISFSLETLQYTPEEAIFIPPRNTIPRQDPFPFYVTKGGAPRNPTRVFASAPGTCTRIIPAADDAERVRAMCSPGGDLDVPVPTDAAVLATYTGITTNIQIIYSGCDGDCTIRYNASTQRCINAVQKVEYTIQLGLTTISSLNVAVTVASFDASATLHLSPWYGPKRNYDRVLLKNTQQENSRKRRERRGLGDCQ
ncbi:hypothetical protein PTSG_11968 [Salpingoeca rosetta]|uniref:Tectonic domain-containing protein n=1 Tax=Salpingoeca rosetta (strain ATCC 50818 / BSB-021) TaxID=946362 RepID=F2U4A3_SALR5|nr:uncharacterized protein PTSG_11968 [Salpingoeca rosetta]EGD82469.1 hypothetical protein PTSG_11968 [Salpingoeca rosetta]|eukprot:XP_004995705.1 hypothetical protein PTSG_11968 [Salpingoeca rosetta]